MFKTIIFHQYVKFLNFFKHQAPASVARDAEELYEQVRIVFGASPHPFGGNGSLLPVPQRGSHPPKRQPRARL